MGKKKTPKGQTAFDFVARGEDLPLFSGCVVRVNVAPFRPRPVIHQPRLFGRVTLEELQEADAQRKRNRQK